jgi:hypothetical protein
MYMHVPVEMEPNARRTRIYILYYVGGRTYVYIHTKYKNEPVVLVSLNN